jgi:hypothetical protein
MKVLICCARYPTHRYLINLLSKSLIKEITGLINNDRHSDAIMVALSKGSVEKIVPDEEMGTVKADLILSEYNARWDLC